MLRHFLALFYFWMDIGCACPQWNGHGRNSRIESRRFAERRPKHTVVPCQWAPRDEMIEYGDLSKPSNVGWLVNFTFFIFPYIENNHPTWLIFFRGVETTNQWVYNNNKPPIWEWLIRPIKMVIWGVVYYCYTHISWTFGNQAPLHVPFLGAQGVKFCFIDDSRTHSRDCYFHDVRCVPAIVQYRMICVLDPPWNVYTLDWKTLDAAR